MAARLATAMLDATDGRRVAFGWHGLGALSLSLSLSLSHNFSPSFVPHLSVAASFPFTTFERLFPPSFLRSFVRSLFVPSLLPVRSIVTILSSLTACPSVRLSARPMGRWPRSARALQLCKSPSREGPNILFLARARRSSVAGRREVGKAEGRHGRQGRACMYA